MFIFNKREYNSRRKELRTNPTQAEIRLWGYLSKSQLGFKFRRQHGVGSYIVDFYCPAKKLIIELDGDSHFTNEQQIYDQERTDYLNALGLTVVRFTNQMIFSDMEGVLMEIQNKLNSQTPSNSPLERGRDRVPASRPF